jgi:hypothetical protein
VELFCPGLKSNQYHNNFDSIARIGCYWRWTDDGGKNWDYNTFGFTKSDLPSRFKEDFPEEVEDFTRILSQRFFKQNAPTRSGRSFQWITLNIDIHGEC